MNSFEPDMTTSESFWQSAKARASRWTTALRTFEHDLNSDGRGHNPWPALEIIVEEIVASEMLTRIWSAMLVSIDHANGEKELTPMAHSVFISHLEARNRVMRILLNHQSQNTPLFNRINQVRRSVEKWTDLFLAILPDVEAAGQFAFDEKRFEDYSREQGHYTEEQNRQRCEVLLRSASTTFRAQCGRWSANPELNRRILDGIVAGIGYHAFEREQLPSLVASLWTEKSHSDTQVLVERLAQLDA
ncbi:MAG: hypothetical protein R3C03_08750 [Pirellulaceae bacterium]